MSRLSMSPSVRRLLPPLVAVVALAAGFSWWLCKPAKTVAVVHVPAKGIVLTTTDSHQTLDSLALNGDVRRLPSDPILSEALSPTSRLDFRLRLQVVNKLGPGLSVKQTDFLRSFVLDTRVPRGMTASQLRALKNDVLNVLTLQAGEGAALAKLLRQVYEDKSQDPALRDYALQFLAPLAESNPDTGWKLHWEALAGDDAALAATAMLHLTLADRGGKLTSAEHTTLAAAALKLASDPTQKETSRATALQVCGQLKLTEARPLAREISRSDQAGFPLRIAAVATLGDLGGDADTRDYLAALTTGSEKRLRVPAQSALKRFPIIN
ncbi:MAG: hypothetical protein WC661_11020 [Opitutaceae bacterium]|jgi:hypothetical protein